MLSLVDSVFSFVPGKFHNGPCVDEYVYTIARLSTAMHTVCTIEAALARFLGRGTRQWKKVLRITFGV
jgi:hypothetical protein